MLIAPGSKVVFIGDSITDCGRAQPVGDGLFGPYGNGWVNAAVGLVGAAYPAHRLRFVNMGVSGNNIHDLEARWDRDVFALKPDWVAVMIGINEVWSQFDLPLHPEYHILPDEYRAALERLAAATLPKVRGMALMAPFYLEPDKAEPMRAMTDRYGQIVRETAQKFDAVFVDTQAAMARLLENCHSSYIAWDRVHPTIVGHMAIARAFLDAVGFKWDGT
jgi:lysophospholipase L1-like esterase